MGFYTFQETGVSMRPILVLPALFFLSLPQAGPPRPALRPAPRRVLRAPWGEAPGSFAREETGARLGPSALAVAKGLVYILDRVHGRVQVFDLSGRLRRVLEVGSRTVDLLAVDGKGRALVLDAFVKKEVRVLEEGKAPAVLPLPAPPRKGLLPSGIFAGKNAVLLEWGHALVSTLPFPGVEPLLPCPITPPPGGCLPGRPAVFGWVQAARSRDGVALLFGRKETKLPVERNYPVRGGVECILDLETDRAGRTAVALFPWDDPSRRILVLLVSASGKILAKRRIAGGSTTDLMSRFSLSPEGLLYQLRTGPEGVEVLEWDWRNWGVDEDDEAPEAGAGKEVGR